MKEGTMSEKFVPLYDLESLNEGQRQDYVRNVCKHMGVPPELNLVMLTYLDENEGPRRLVAYAKRGATEIIRSNREINITSLESKQIGGSIVFTATAKDSTGRQEMSTGSKFIQDLTGKALDDAIMTAQTRACRRVTLQFVGAGVLDESEVNPAQAVQLKETKFQELAGAPLPTVAPTSEPGKDITATEAEAKNNVGPVETQEQFEARQARLRAEAIAQLNEKHQAEQPQPEQPEVKTKRKYVRKAKTIDLGPSEPVPQSHPASVVAPAPTPAPIPEPIPAPPQVNPVVPSQVNPVVSPQANSAKRLTPEQVKPFRQRLFQIVNNQLEPAGFAPKEGMGNQDKMRAFATMMFPEVTNMQELTVEQWEKYLTALELKIKAEGAVSTIKYIEDAIGL